MIRRLAVVVAESPWLSPLIAINLGLSLPIDYRIVLKPMLPIHWSVLTDAGRASLAGKSPYALPLVLDLRDRLTPRRTDR